MPRILPTYIGTKSVANNRIILKAVDITDLCPRRSDTEQVRIEYMQVAGDLVVAIHNCWTGSNYGIATTHPVNPARTNHQWVYFREQAEMFGINSERLQTIISEFAPSMPP